MGSEMCIRDSFKIINFLPVSCSINVFPELQGLTSLKRVSCLQTKYTENVHRTIKNQEKKKEIKGLSIPVGGSILLVTIKIKLSLFQYLFLLKHYEPMVVRISY